MQLIQGSNRYKSYFTTQDEHVSADNGVRPMDGFVDKLEVEKLGFSNTIHKIEGLPPYAPSVLLELSLNSYKKNTQHPKAGKRIPA